MIARLVVLVAGAFSSVRAGDKHLAAAFDALLDPALRQEAQNAGGSPADLANAEADWSRLCSDPRKEKIKHFRDKTTAHASTPTAGIDPPQYAEAFDFARELANVMQKLVHGISSRREGLRDTSDWRIDQPR